jgi:hypothetical protein
LARDGLSARIDLAQQVIGGATIFKIKPVEKPTLRSRALSHHRQPHRFANSMESHFVSPAKAEFFNKIYQKQSLAVRYHEPEAISSLI